MTENGIKRWCTAIALVFGWIGAANAQEPQVSGLQRCAAIDSDTMRLACYDRISGRAKEAPVTDPATADAQGESPAADYTPLTDDIGAESLPPDAREPKDTPAIRATVTSCRQDARQKYYFYFDNGQVWKQKDDDRLSYKVCNFEVTILKDFFGYKMQVDGDGNRIRISRVK